MVIAQITGLKFVLKKDKHVVDYAEKCATLSFTDKPKDGQFKVVVATTLNEAFTILRKQISDCLTNCYFKPKAEDFVFDIRYENIDNGMFWYPLCTMKSDIPVVNP